MPDGVSPDCEGVHGLDALGHPRGSSCLKWGLQDGHKLAFPKTSPFSMVPFETTHMCSMGHGTDQLDTCVVYFREGTCPTYMSERRALSF